MQGLVHWDYPNGSDVFALGWTRCECVYEITKTASATRQGASFTYHLWTIADDTGKLHSLAAAPSPLQLIRAAEQIEESHLGDDPEPLIDRADDPEYVN